MSYHDNVYIGTGPISVIDACLEKKNNRSVLLIDEKEQVGGAWVSIEVGKFGQLEIGCHIWSYNAQVYAFIKDFFKLDLIELKPQPCFIKGKTRLIYDHKNGITSLKHSIRHLKRLDFKGFRNYISGNPAARFPVLPKKYLYPRGGARDLQQAIVNKIDELSLETKMATRLVEIKKTDDLWIIKTGQGEVIHSKKITLTATSSLERILYKDTEIKLEHKFLNYTHFHIIIKGDLLKQCSYVRVLDHEIIHRISDITYQLEDKSNLDHTVILVGVFDDKLPKDQTEDQIVDGIMNYLELKGFVKPDTPIVYKQKNKFETAYISPEQIMEINQLDDTIKVLATTDLMYGIYYRLPDWTGKVKA